MDYSHLTKTELIEKVYELELLNKQLLIEKEQEATLDFCWTGNLGHWYWNVKTNNVTFNPLKITTLGYTEDEVSEVVGFEFFTSKLHPEDYPKAMASMRNHLLGKADVYELEYRIKAKDGSYKWYYDRGKITQYNKQEEPVLVSGIVFDITKRKEEELDIRACNERLLEQSMTDPLTGLKNRRSLMEYLKMWMNFTNKESLSIAIFDIDDFSKVNDTMGHIVGDKVLIQVGQIMTDLVRKTDMVGRYGGEEFLIIYPTASLKQTMGSSERIRQAIEDYNFAKDCRITISGGVYQYQGESVEEFINKADQNLYKAKNEGKNKIKG